MERRAFAQQRGAGRRSAIVLGLAMYWLAASSPATAGPEGYLIDFNALLVIDTANPSIVARIPLGGYTTSPPVVDPRSTRVYVVHRLNPIAVGAADGVAIVDTASRTVISTVPVQFPQDVLLRPQGDRLYVTTQETSNGAARGGISIVDTATNTVVGAVILGTHVGKMAVDRSGARLYVVVDNRPSGGISLAVLEGASGAVVTTIPLAGVLQPPFAMAVYPDGIVYLAGQDVLVVDSSSGSGHTVMLPPAPPLMSRALTALVVDPAGEVVLAGGRYAAVAEVNGTQGFMSVIDAPSALVLAEVPLPLIPEAGAVHPGGRVFVTGRPLGSCGARPTGCSKEPAGVAIVDLPTRQLVGLVDTGPTVAEGVSGIPPMSSSLAPPAWEGVEVHPDRSRVYAAERNGRLSVLEATTGTIVAQVAGAGIALASGPPPFAGAQQLYVVPSSGLPPAAFALGAPGDHPVTRDYDGDGWLDLAAWRPREGGEEGLWLIRGASSAMVLRQQWGAAAFGDVLVPADYDGDGRVDLAVWRPFQGGWYVVRSSDGNGVWQAWGGYGDVPVPADYDGDGRADMAIWRPGFGDEPAAWFILSTSGPPAAVSLGAPTDVPVPADYDGDGRADPAVWRPSTGEWLVRLSSSGILQTIRFGQAGDVPVPADYDGDGRADTAVWRPSTGEWFILRSSDGAVVTRQWGAAGDRPMPADYDGDGRADLAVYRP